MSFKDKKNIKTELKGAIIGFILGSIIITLSNILHALSYIIAPPYRYVKEASKLNILINSFSLGKPELITSLILGILFLILGHILGYKLKKKKITYKKALFIFVFMYLLFIFVIFFLTARMY